MAYTSNGISKVIETILRQTLSTQLPERRYSLQTDYIRVVVPSELQTKTLSLLHEGHWGSCRMKQLARRYMWFPNMDKAIENVCQSCIVCRSVASAPKREFVPWPEPKEAWERIHLDFAGPFFGTMWLIVVDSFLNFRTLCRCHPRRQRKLLRYYNKYLP